MMKIWGIVISLLVAHTALAQKLDFDEPSIQEKKETGIPGSIGPVTNIQIGGAIDWRVTYLSGSKRPVAFIHVNELVVSASVGQHISVSAEQLLLTSEMSTVIGQDHGFVVVSLAQLPFVPNGMSFKLGRFRGKFGTDAYTDSPANIFPSAALRSNAMVTDLGLGLDYTLSNSLEAIVEVFNGADYKLINGRKTPFQTHSLPVQVRIVYQPSSRIKFGLSGFVGETWDNILSPEILDQGSLGSQLDTSRTITRKRLGLDASMKSPLADITVEAIVGRDKDRLSQEVDSTHSSADGGLIRGDIPLFKVNDETRTKLAVQYDAWKDASYEGRVGFISTALSVLSDAGWIFRFGGSMSDLAFKKLPAHIEHTPWNATTQLLVSF